MFFIPGIVITFLTFPGVIVHELAHQLFCRLFKIPVFEVCYFKVGNPAGYVIHEAAPKTYQSVLISIGPFFLNTLLGFLIAFPAVFQFEFDSANLFDYVLLYLGVSIAMHAFPSTGDATSLWNSVMSKEGSNMLTKIVIAPIVGFIYIGALGSFFWLDAIYGVGVAYGLPKLLVHLFS
jgi:hypothetical protein